MFKQAIGAFMIFIALFAVLPFSAFANHQISFTTDKAVYIQGKENVALTLQDTDNDGALIGWDGVAIYDAVGNEVANYDDNWVGQGHPIQAGQNLIWSWDQKYELAIGGTYFDMHSWLSAANVNNFCELEPDNMVCNE